jgi:hypothetical protein
LVRATPAASVEIARGIASNRPAGRYVRTLRAARPASGAIGATLEAALRGG